MNNPRPDPPVESDPELRRLIARELQVEASSTTRTLYFHGESMRPFLGEGDEVVVAPVEWEEIRRGDVITYRYLDRFPTRRVVRKHAGHLDLWCDNWPTRFFTAPRADVLGRAVARGRQGAWIRETGAEWRAARRAALARWFRIAAAQACREGWLRIARLIRKTGLRRPWPH